MVAVPRYLFRVTSPGSDGQHDASGFHSMAKCKKTLPPGSSLESLGHEEARAMVKDHVLWESRKTRDDDVLISFTSSFYFAVQHALRKASLRYGGTTRDNCRITILDTQMFPDVAFHWTPDLLDTYDLRTKHDKRLFRDYHEAEYLVEYELPLSNTQSFRSASLEDLEVRGYLFEALPHLDPSSTSLVMALSSLRSSNFASLRPIDMKLISRAQRLAGVWGGQFQCPLVLWILSAHKRNEKDPILIEAFGEGLNGRLTAPLWISDADDSGPPSSVKELVEWLKLATAVLPLQHRDEDVDDVAELFGQATLDD